MKQVKQVEIAIIGAGSAGLSAYRAAKAHSDSVLLIEGGEYGTTCARVGCMPSKLLIAAADCQHAIDKAPQFGIHASSQVDGAAVLQRVRRERDRFVGLVVESIEQFPAADKRHGRVRFVDDHHLMFEDGEQIRAQRIVIATGSRPSYPDFFQQAGNRLITNDALFDLPDLPGSVAVFGPGVIGLELGQALARLGVKVWMFGVGGGLGSLQDEAIKDCAAELFAQEFYLDCDAQVNTIKQQGETVLIDFLDKQGQAQQIEVDYLLAATGRRPNVDQLGLEHTSLELDERGVPIADIHTLQTSVSHIFIAGDANNQRPLLHEAADEGRIAGQNAGRFPDIYAGQRRTPLAVVFSAPQIASVGLSLQELNSRYPDGYACGEASFADQGRARVMLVNQGMIKVYGEQGTGRLLGAELLAPAAEHLAHLLAFAVQQQLTVSQALALPFYHPVLEEGLRGALRKLNRNLQLGPEPVERCLDCGPGS